MDNLFSVQLASIFSFRNIPRKDAAWRIFFLGLVVSFVVLNTTSLVTARKWINKPFAGFLVNQRMVVATIGPAHWSGVKAGLTFPDKILTANNQPVASMKDLDNILGKVKIGDPVTYTVKRRGQVIEVTIPVMLFTWRDFLIMFVSDYLTGNIYFLLGVIVFVLKPWLDVSMVFLVACIIIGIMKIIAFDIATTHIGMIRILLFSQTILPAVALHLSFLFPSKLNLVRRHPFIQAVPYIISAILLIPFEGFYPNPVIEKIYIAVYLYTALSGLGFITTTIYSYVKSASMLTSARAKVIIFGAVLAFPIPILAQILLTLGKTLGGMPIQVALMPLLIFPASIAYAIARHNLFDVDVYIKRAVGYVLMTVLVAMTYFALQTSIRTFVLSPLLGEGAEKVYPILFALLVVFFFNPLSRLVQGWVDKLFYRKKFDYKATVTSVSQALTSLLNLEDVIRQVIHTVRKEMFIDTAGVVLLGPKDRSCQTLFIGNNDDPNNPISIKDQTRDVCINYDDPLLTLLSKEKKLITRHDIAEDPKYVDIKEACGQRFTEMGSSLAIPMIHKDEMKGALLLGNKKSGHFYTREDIDLLTTLTSQGAVAIENARLLEENLEKQRMEDELKIAHDIQVSMLPEKAPEIDGFEIAGRSIPAKEVGGDFYDFIEIDSKEGNRKLGIVVGDVTGKGVSGALMMAASRSTYRVLAEQYSSVEELMGVGNRRMNKDIKKGMFVALLYAELNPEERTLVISNAGQTQPILCPAERSTQPHYIDTEGDKFPLGIIKDCTYQETKVPLKSGDVVVCYTDGVVEAMNEKGEMYGFERLMTSIDEARGLGADAVMDKLMNDISSYVGDVEQHDDLTIVVVKVG